MREPWERGCRRSSAEAPVVYPNKNSNNRKIASARWTIGGGKRFSLYGYLRKAFSSRVFRIILLLEKLMKFDWLRAVVFQLNLKYLHVKITTFCG